MAPNARTPAAITSGTLTAGWVRQLALWGLCAAYLQGGIDKLGDFSRATAEMQHFGLAPPAAAAVLAVVVELLGAAMVLSGIYRWAGALALAAFTLASTFVANRFWQVSGDPHFMLKNAFFEHLGLAGGFLLVAWLDLRERERAA